MFLNGDLEQDESRAEDAPSRGWAFAVGVCMLPVYLAFSAFGAVGKGTIAACALGTLAVAVRMHIEHIKKRWFWGIIVTSAIADILLIAFVPFPNKNYAFPLVAPFGILQYLLIRMCIKKAEKR